MFGYGSRHKAVRSLFAAAKREKTFIGDLKDVDYFVVLEGPNDGWWEVQDPPGSGHWRPLNPE